jgi:hypothetical protein
MVRNILKVSENNGEDELGRSCRKNEVVLQSVKDERNIIETIKRRETNWTGHILRRNSLLKHVFEGEMEGRIEAT